MSFLWTTAIRFSAFTIVYWNLKSPVFESSSYRDSLLIFQIFNLLHTSPPVIWMQYKHSDCSVNKELLSNLPIFLLQTPYSNIFRDAPKWNLGRSREQRGQQRKNGNLKIKMASPEFAFSDLSTDIAMYCALKMFNFYSANNSTNLRKKRWIVLK